MSVFELIFKLLYWIYKEIQFRIYYGPIFHRFLNRKYLYYSALPWPLKMKFLRMARDQYEYFDFVPRENIVLTREMKAIICSGATQLILYLPEESLSFYTRILVYPDHYNSLYTHKEHKGEVNPGLRLIVFSWSGVIEALEHREAKNLLLHEFAHALWLETKLMGHQYEVLSRNAIQAFEELAATEFHKMEKQAGHFLRSYAFTNIEEFFAVSVENFFERPAEFRRTLPELYGVLVAMFHQDPEQVYAEARLRSNKEKSTNDSE